MFISPLKGCVPTTEKTNIIFEEGLSKVKRKRQENGKSGEGKSNVDDEHCCIVVEIPRETDDHDYDGDGKMTTILGLSIFHICMTDNFVINTSIVWKMYLGL